MVPSASHLLFSLVAGGSYRGEGRAVASLGAIQLSLPGTPPFNLVTPPHMFCIQNPTLSSELVLQTCAGERSSVPGAGLGVVLGVVVRDPVRHGLVLPVVPGGLEM